MDAVRIETLPTTKSLINTSTSETTDISKEKDDDILFVDELDEDDEIRLRLSDDEETEQDSNISEHFENQQSNLQIKENDLDHLSPVSKLKETLNKSEVDIISSTQEDENLSDSNFNEKIVNGICINDEESIMSGRERIPPLMQNSPKYWSNDFEKRWKGTNRETRGRKSFSRNHNDWYSQQYPEKDKLNNRNNFNNHNNHYNKFKNNGRGSYNSPSRDSCNKEVNKDNINQSPKLKSDVLESEDCNRTNHIKQENGISKDLYSKEHELTVRKDKLDLENKKLGEKETKTVEIDSDQKENECINDESKLPSDQKCKDNGSSSTSDNFKYNGKSKNELSDTKDNSNSVLSEPKDCDASMTELKEEKCDSESEIIRKSNKNETSFNNSEQKLKDMQSLSENPESESKDSASDKTSCETQVEIAEEASHDNDIVEEQKIESPMEVDENSGNLCSNSDNNTSNNQKSKSDETKNNEISEKDRENAIEDQPEEKTENKKVSELDEEKDDEKQCNDQNLNIAINDDSSHSLDSKKSSDIIKMEISQIELNDETVTSTADNENKELMEVEINDESLDSSTLAVSGIEDSKSNDTKPLKEIDEKSLLERSPDGNAVDQEEKSSEMKISEETLEKNSTENKEGIINEEKSNSSETNEQEKVSNIIEEVDLVDDEPELEMTINADNFEATKDASTLSKGTSQTVPISTVDNGVKAEESNEDGRAVVHKRRRRKRQIDITYKDMTANETTILSENGGRQKRRSARNAEEMIRKEILKNDEDEDDSSDESSRVVSHKKSAFLSAQPLSPPSLKRGLDELDHVPENVTLKKIKASDGTLMTVMVPVSYGKKEHAPKSRDSVVVAKELVRKISQEDIRGKLKKLKQEELEALLLQKIVECITIRGEMGKLREQARASKRSQEATRVKCQQLQKQVEGFDMVLKRISYDKNSNNEKYMPPIKINRSVGLQVNFLSDHGIQNLKQIQVMKAGGAGANNVVKVAPDNRAASPRKMMKTRSPRRPDVSTTTITPADGSASPPAITPTALVMNKTVDANGIKRTIGLPNSSNIVVVPPGQQQQTVVVNSTVGGQTSSRPATLTIQRAIASTPNSKTSDLIDLTDEEDKSKSPVITPMTSRFSRVLQAVPASVALNNSTNLRIVPAGSQGSPTTIVNNMNTPRLAYVMQSGVSGVPTRQLVLATSSSTIRPVTSVSARNISTISYKQGVPTLTNGTVRVLTTQAPTANVQVSRHPAPLPESPATESNPSWKLAPPSPSLKISKVATGIVLSWNMTLSDKFAEIVSYQLYAYQEITGTSPSAALWKKVGDVRALPLPMACTLTQFTEGNNYYFAVRAVDVHSRFGQYSKPGNISL